MKIYYLIGVFMCAILYSCSKEADTSGKTNAVSKPLKSQAAGEIPEEVSLSDVKATEFALTFENKLSDSSTSIYAPAFLFAWQEVKEYFKYPIHVTSENSIDFRLINESKSFQKSLNKGGYESSIDTSADGIVARAYFKKTLPFAVKFHPQHGISFGTTRVKSFGINDPDEELKPYFKILYYLDDDHFAIRLFPADTSSIITLVKGIDLAGTFKDLYNRTNVYIEKGWKEKESAKNKWKYTFAEGDYLSIPVVKFNIGTHYSSLEGQQFTSRTEPHNIVEAYQRTAFVFDEYGAIVESEAVVACDSTSMAPEAVQKPTPKNMIFDKPFVIFIQKKNSNQPYFAMKVMNTELMEKE